MKKSAYLYACALFTIFLSSCALAQGTASGTQNRPVSTENSPSDFDKKLEDIKSDVQKTDQQIKELRDGFSKTKEQLDEFKTLIKGFGYGASIITFIATVIGILSFFGLRKNETDLEKKAAERETSVNQLLTLFNTGEMASQKRAAELHNVMLKEGGTTLSLVNDTLTLAKTASERAIKALGSRERSKWTHWMRKQIDFWSFLQAEDSRDIVNKREHRDRLKAG